MKSYQPLLVAVVVGLLVTGCYYLPNGGSTGDLSFYTRFTNPNPTYDAFRMELLLEDDLNEPLVIGPDGARFLDMPLTGTEYLNQAQGPYMIANIPARRRYVLRVSTWNYDPGSTVYSRWPTDSSPFEVLPGQTAYVSVDFC